MNTFFLQQYHNFNFIGKSQAASNQNSLNGLMDDIVLFYKAIN